MESHERASAPRRLWSGGILLLQVLAPLLARLVLGYAFIQTGWGKWHNFDRTTSFFTEIGIPFPAANAAFVATLELLGGACLMIGLWTRVFSLLLSSTMVVAILTADKQDFLAALTGVGDKGLTDIVPFVFLMFLSLLAAWGAGSASVDRWICRRG